LLLTLAKM